MCQGIDTTFAATQDYGLDVNFVLTVTIHGGIALPVWRPISEMPL